MKLGSNYRFHPLVLPGVLAWIDLQDSQYRTLVGSDVSAVVNQKTGVAWTEANVRPSFNATGINSRPCMVGDGTEHIIATEESVGQGLNGTNVPHTVMVVGKIDTPTSISTFCSIADSAGASENYRAFGYGTTAVRMASQDSTTASGTGSADNPSPDTNPHIWTYINFGSTPLAFYGRQKWTPVISGSFSLGSFASNRVGLFTNARQTPTQYLTGRIGSVLIMRGAISHSHWMMVMDYLEERWNF